MSSQRRAPREYRDGYSNDNRLRIRSPPISIGTFPASLVLPLDSRSGSKMPVPIEYRSTERSKRAVPLAMRRRAAAFDARTAFRDRDAASPADATYRSSHASV